jgi:hypothetical protein
MGKQLSAFSGQPSAVSLQRSAFSGQPSAVSLQRSAFSGQPSAVSLQLRKEILGAFSDSFWLNAEG